MKLKPITIGANGKKVKEKTQEEKELEELFKSLVFQPQDRPLSEEEEIYFDKALILNKEDFRPLKPIVGRLGFYLRNYHNDEVVEILRTLLDGYLEGQIENFDAVDRRTKDEKRWIRDVIKIYERLDFNSQNRVDVFDWLARDLEVSVPKFFGAFQEAAVLNQERITTTSIEQFKPLLLHATMKFALQGKNFKDRELLMRVFGFDKPASQISIQDNSQNVILTQDEGNKKLFGNFTSSMKKVEKEVESEQKMLEEGKQEFIDAEIVEEKEKTYEPRT